MPSARTGEKEVYARRLRRDGHSGGQSTQQGVGLIEVLVAVLILSIAFLGIAALQAMSLSTNNSAMTRSLATISSYSIMDAMRADLVRARAGDYNTSKAITADKCPGSGDSFATTQLNGWCNQLAKNFGAVSTTTANINCLGTGECTVTISYNDIRAGADGNKAQSVVTKAIL
ncbi:type IV pilus modification protein PilV [Dyella sp. 20L07]|uniref:type IV pilus modification protein PilV n=1 Tax=Dyella sp. 20L07 TaxID=3384240 RepID=UPI003D2D25E8